MISLRDVHFRSHPAAAVARATSEGAVMSGLIRDDTTEMRTPVARPPKPRRARSRRAQRRGATIVEFAMVAPLFFLLIFGMIEFGRMIMVQQLLVAASREGGREAMLDGTTSGAVITRVRDYLTSTSIDGAAATVTVTPDPATAETGTEITVTVSIPFENVSWFVDPWYLDDVNLRAACVMRHE
jgi:hypothetical protein